MDIKQIKKIVEDLYTPVFSVENYFPHHVRKYVEKILRFLFIISFAIFIFLQIFKRFVPSTYLINIKPEVNGITAILFTFWVIVFLIQCFYNSYYYLQSKPEVLDSVFIDFDLAFAISKIKTDDITKSFFKSRFEELILLRSGVDSISFDKFLSGRTSIINPENFKCEITDNKITIKDFALSVFDQDKSLRDYLFAYGIKKEEICGITEWIMDSNSAYRERARWWSRDNLLKKKGIGQNWAYGQIFNLKQYEKPLVSASGYYSIQTNYVLNEGKELETILLRKNGANIILVGNDEAGKFQIISDLSKRIYEGQVLSSLNDKRVVLFNDKLMLIRNNSKQKFEIEFVKIMNEAVLAGNIILVFDDFSGFILGAETIGVDLPSILAPYLISSSLQIVAFTDKERFHSVLERNVLVSQHFEIILIKEIDNYGCIKVLENEVRVFENDGMFFTYPALVSIVTGGQRYFSDGIMPDKAIDFLQEIAPKLNSNGKRIVEEKDVVALIQTKTGIPMGDVGPKEKEKLLNLESLLSKKIIGQNEAVVAISHAVRRARSGINNPNRPLGSFLFLGSTGVGKTETSKVLAEVFFGQDANIIRLDMSEYSGPDSVAKLIGSFGKSQAGTLSTMLKEHPYGVLLLDEFEKTTQEVMNLFLQILDEGLFSDGSGNKVNARNLIIIATSNAGSQIIWKKQQNGDDLMKAKDEIVESIIQEGVFKAELINRFDGVILFHPLDEASISKIAELLLYKLHDRLADRGIDLVVNQDLIDFVVGFGFDPKFGARTMYRVIQEKVEEIIAEKIIAGTGVAGQKFILSKEDLV